ncbi:hypothetical protein [Cryobacterium sp. N22]|uniref:hypothetical protein n=1 Tax=Cryobacterium sp. N22 TaxID=2048290 RepID=UPI000CE36E41|nr:hypothetical protein [Cryobacterium sp. N22]
MTPIKDDDRPTDVPTVPELLQPSEPPFQALFPNLDRVSRSSWHKGTVSRRRIGRATGVLVGVIVVIAALVVGSVIL